MPALRMSFLIMNTGTFLYLGITIGRSTAFRKDHVVALFPNANEALKFEYARQNSVEDRTKSEHEPVGAGS